MEPMALFRLLIRFTRPKNTSTEFMSLINHYPALLRQNISPTFLYSSYTISHLPPYTSNSRSLAATALSYIKPSWLFSPTLTLSLVMRSLPVLYLVTPSFAYQSQFLLLFVLASINSTGVQAAMPII